MATRWSVIANRRDKTGQIPWTEWRVPAVSVGGCEEQAGALVLLGPCGKLDPSILPPISGANVYVNGNPVPIAAGSPDFNNTMPAAPAGYSNVIWQYSGNDISAYYATSGVTAVPFNIITSGTNTMAAMVVGDGASLTVACPGTGVIEATELATNTCTPVVTDISAPTHPGQLLISQPGNASAVWADPLVQGLYPTGSSTASPPPYSPPTTIQPVLIGGATQDGLLENLLVTVSGEAVVLTQDQETDPNVLRFSVTTGAALVTNMTANLVPLLSVQPKIGAGSVTFTLRNLDFLTRGLTSHFQLLLNATLTGANFIDVDPASSAQYDVSATSYSGGRLIDSGFVNAESRRNSYELRFGFTGSPPTNPDTLTMVFSPVAGSSKSIAGGSLAWDEQISAL